MDRKSLSEIQQRLDALFQPWNRSDAPGLVIGVALAGQPVYRRGFGLASLEQGVANSAATRMRIASTSKHFASVAALLLAEESLLDLDAPARRYLPELSGPAGEPTPRQLMTHSGGLRDPYDLPGILLHRGFAAQVAEGMGLEVTRRFTGANFAPGERMIYCNNGYHLLSLMIERVSGQTFGDFLRERILAPLGMHHTELLCSDLHILPGIAAFHLPGPDGRWRRGIYPSEELLGSGGLVSNIDDMLSWLAHLRGEKTLGSPRVWEQLLQRPRYGSGSEGSYCLGLTRETYRGVETVHHAGSAMGCTCQMLTVPGHALDIVVMCNRMDASAPQLALKVVDAVLGNGVLAPADVALSPEDHPHLPGRWYAPDSHRVFSITTQCATAVEPPALALAVHQQLLGVLRQQPPGRLGVCASWHGAVELVLPAAGSAAPDTLEFRDSGHAERLVRLPAVPPPVAARAAAMRGRYRYVELGVELALVTDAEGLYLDLLPAYGRSRLRLEPYSDEVFGFALESTASIPFPCLGTLVVEREGDAVRGLWLNSARTRNLWLERLG